MDRLGILLALLLTLVASSMAWAHEGHSEVPTPAAASERPRLESDGSELEIVATANGDVLTIYLDRKATNEPVGGATIEVSGDGIAAAEASEVSPGTYELHKDWISSPGEKTLVFFVTADGQSDLLNGVLDIHGPEAENVAEAPTSFWLNPMIWGVAAAAAAIGFFLAFAFRPSRLPADSNPDQVSRPAIKAIKHAAEIIVIAAFASAIMFPDARAHEDHAGSPKPAASGDAPRRLPDGDVMVPKPSQRLLEVRTIVAKSAQATSGEQLGGLVISNPSSAGQVQAPMDGQIELAERGISYVGQKVKAGEVLAALAPSMPVYERGALQQLAADVEGKMRIAEQKLNRLNRISGIIAQKEIEDTQVELDALRVQQRALAPKSAERLMLKAPVDGLISVANVRPGQVVSARDTLFEIVDPQKLWVEAIGAAGHATGDVAGAHAIDDEGHRISLKYIGRAPTLRQQTLPLLFEVEGEHDGLNIGMAVKVVVQRNDTRKGVTLPDAAIVRGASGVSQVWIKIAPERFKAALVRTAPLDGENVLVVSGLEDGARVVTRGAELINQIR